MSVVTEALEAIDALLETEDKWTQGVNAADISGKPIDFLSPEATCFCINGAHERVFDNNRHKEGYSATWSLLGDAATELLPSAEHTSPIDVNDDTDFATVKRMIARAKELAWERGL